MVAARRRISFCLGALATVCLGPVAGAATLVVEGANSPYALSSGSLSTTETDVGLTGTGVFNHSGGSHTTGDLELGSGAASAGTYNLSGTGSLTASKVNVGVSGMVIFTHSAGTFSTNGASLRIAASAGNSGTYESSTVAR